MDSDLTKAPQVDTESLAIQEESVVPFRKLTVILANLDEDSSDNVFCWANPVSTRPLDEDGNLITGPVGSVMIYGLPKSMLKGGTDGGSNGFHFVGYVRPRAIAGLFDFVPEESVKQVLKAQGLELSDVPEARYVASTTPTLNRAQARQRGTAARTLRRAANGSATAMLQLQTGTGSLEAGSDLANAVKAALAAKQQQSS
jgi:hypothetical protein